MKDLIQKKNEEYDCLTLEDEENAVKEITQEVILFSLSRTDFFSKASFQGGSCLRIVHGLDRFSEDLDFVLNKVDLNFELSPYLAKVSQTMNVYGYDIEVTGKDKADSHIRKRFIKDDSLKKILNFRHYSDSAKKIKIKFELDVNPPLGSANDQEYLDFPIDFSIAVQNKPSLFAGKCHALLCREYTKGRDWYDFSWYCSKKTKPNYILLSSALNQSGPWKNLNPKVNREWLLEMLQKKIKNINWDEAIKDISRFLKPDKQDQLSLWGTRFFLKKAAKI
ncbi:MAG: nucleotidyl transferase AbiEii/AbiGii toxin family protein [Proteobacteria bacterium]|nr:nucleotidyl transferase AbiEii/AbiGii toxin family protein [Pseudomonadota bacterium]